MSRRAVVVVAILLLLVQAMPTLACVAMPAQPLTTCCCEADGDCAMALLAGRACAVPEACCVQATGSTPALSTAAAQPDDRAMALPIAYGAPPHADSPVLIEKQAALDAANRYRHRSVPPPAVPLYLRHLRLTL